MTFLLFVGLVPLVFMLRARSRKIAVQRMQARPYRYQIETRRSPWNRRAGGF